MLIIFKYKMSTENEGEVSQLESSLLGDLSQPQIISKSFDQEGKRLNLTYVK